MPLPPSLLAPALRALILAQRRRLGPWAEVIARAARLDSAPDAIETSVAALRARFAASDETIAMQDFGAGTRGGVLSAEDKPDMRRVADIYRRAAATPAWGRFLFHLVRELRPSRVLELGTNLGISAAHLTAALEQNETGHLATLEGDPTLARLACDHLDPAHATVVTGRFDDTLPGVLEAHGPFDLVFLDGHHEEAATLRYFARIRPHLAPGACVAFDDIEPFRPVRRAWKRIVTDEPASGTADLLGLGLWFAPTDEAKEERRTKAAAGVQ